MGKKDKKPWHNQHRSKGLFFYNTEEEEDGYGYPQASFSGQDPEPEDCFQEEEEEVEGSKDAIPSSDIPSKFLLYQQSVQSPKGDISYLQKFFLMYVGEGRLSISRKISVELLCLEWLHSDPRRTAVGMDLDLEALNWCMENNINKVGADGYSRISLFRGNVLQPSEAKLVRFGPQEMVSNIKLSEHRDNPKSNVLESTVQAGLSALPARDIVCAFNFSCCLHRRADLVLHFKHVLDALSKKGGIFVMDLYGGPSLNDHHYMADHHQSAG